MRERFDRLLGELTALSKRSNESELSIPEMSRVAEIYGEIAEVEEKLAAREQKRIAETLAEIRKGSLGQE
jgi:hypothetical protein